MRIFPDWPTLSDLRPPLTEGEEALLRFLDENLPEAWNIYAQPYVNDMRPDVVVVKPEVGLVVYEVKDWTLTHYGFEGQRLIARTSCEEWLEEDPLTKSRWYAESLFKQFLVSDEAELDIGYSPNNLSLFRSAVYFYRARASEVEALYEGKKQKLDILLGFDSLTKKNLKEVTPYCFMPRSKLIRDRQN